MAFVRKNKDKKRNITRLHIVEGYRDKNNKVKHRVLESCGILEELILKDPNILEKLNQKAKNFNNDNVVSIQFNLNDSSTERTKPVNYGYFFLEAIYKSLEIDKFIKNKSTNYKFKYDLDEIVRLLTFSRILNPASKLETVNKQDKYFEPFSVKLEDVYRSLNVLNDIKEDLQIHLHQQISKQYNRDCSLVFYDVTNYYFEIDNADEDELDNEGNIIKEGIRKEGKSKENKKTPLVSMGLLIDNKGIPIAYKLFSGNKHDSKTLIPTMDKLKQQYNLNRIITVADKGLNSGNNLGYLTNNEDGYIVSQKVRGMSKQFIQTVLDDEDYIYNQDKTFKIKDFIRERVVETDDSTTVTLKEKVVCFWSKDYDDREKHKRDKLEKRIDEYLKNPNKYKASNKYGIKKYLKEVPVDEKTGEVKDIETTLAFDETKYNNDVALDGFYCLITSELEMTNQEILSNYRGLWKIEESFRVMKSDLEGRPVYVSNNDRIEGHFLVCYLALTIMRILEYKLDNKHSTNKIKEALNEAMCKPLKNKDIYLFDEVNDVFRKIEKTYNVNGDFAQIGIEKIKQYKKEILTTNKKQ